MNQIWGGGVMQWAKDILRELRIKRISRALGRAVARKDWEAGRHLADRWRAEREARTPAVQARIDKADLENLERLRNA